MDSMDSKMDSEKNVYKYVCEKCNFKSCNKYNFSEHISSLKHKKQEMDSEKCEKMYHCNCGKKYKYDTGLYKHKKNCQGEKKEKNTIIQSDNKDDMKDLVFKLINENQELRKTITEMIPKMGNNNNNLKQKFNINLFLNEKCKDALSMDEFIDKIEISMKNLLITKEKGQAQGISNIIMENMNKLSLYERPLHCTDKKRETLYVKNNEWEKDENKEYLNKALKKVEKKQLKNIQLWLDAHPNYMNCSVQQDEFAELLRECGKSIDDNREKIIKNLCDNVYIEKVDDEGL
jgi:hypothetical protein